MALIGFFGLPGVGKSFVGGVWENLFGDYHYDADQDLMPEMQRAIKEKKPFTPEMRERYYLKVIRQIERLCKKHLNFIFSQALFKRKYRDQLRENFPQLVLVEVQASNHVAKIRIIKRVKLQQKGKKKSFSNHQEVTLEYVKKIRKYYEQPAGDEAVFVLNNNTDNDQNLNQKLKKLRDKVLHQAPVAAGERIIHKYDLRVRKGTTLQNESFCLVPTPIQTYYKKLRA